MNDRVFFMAKFAAMSTHALSNIFPDAPVRVLKENPEYGFNIIEVTLDYPKTKLIMTQGLSDYTQNVPDDSKEFARCELVFCLPEYHNLERDAWPIEWLNRIAMVPKKSNSWFGPGDTLPAGNPPQELADNFKANHFILSEPIILESVLEKHPDQFENFKLFSVIPIFQPEFDFKMRNNGRTFLIRYRRKGKDDMVDVFRTSTCRKRILGF